jgi:hypothetical protein
VPTEPNNLRAATRDEADRLERRYLDDREALRPGIVFMAELRRGLSRVGCGALVFAALGVCIYAGARLVLEGHSLLGQVVIIGLPVALTVPAWLWHKWSLRRAMRRAIAAGEADLRFDATGGGYSPAALPGGGPGAGSEDA